MNGVGKTAAQIDAANRYEAYMRGWKDGASIKAMRQEMTALAPKAPLRLSYEDGYTDGRTARAAASQYATRVTGHEPTILRLQADGE